MKKSILAVAGVAAFAGVAMPVAGVFAADTLTPITDTVTLTIDSACSLSGTGATASADMANGALKSDITGTTYTIKCNDKGGWHLTAVGAGEATDATEMKASNSTSTNIATGTATSGASSQWAFKVTGDQAVEGYKAFSAIPAIATDVASDTDSSVGQKGTTIQTTYQIFVSDTQQADTYTGKVTYTLAHPKTASQ